MPTLAAWLVLVVGFGISLSAFRSLQRQVRQEMRSEFEADCSEIQRSLQSQLASYEHVLRGLRGLFSQAPVTRRDFHDYLTGLDLASRYPAALIVSYAQDVSQRQRPSFERAIARESAREGYPRFAITPLGVRPRYHVVTYIEPREAYAGVLGVDLEAVRPGSDRVIQEMRDTGDLVSTGQVVRENGEHVVLRLAVYRRHRLAGTVEQRRAAFVGSVGLGVSLERLIRDAVTPAVASRVYFSIHDIGSARNPGPLEVDSSANELIDSTRIHRLSNTEWAGMMSDSRLQFGSRILGVQFYAPTTGYGDRVSRTYPFVVLVFGTLTTLLIFILIHSLHRSAVELEDQVSRRTRDLEEANRRLREEMSQRARLEQEVLRVAEEERKALGQDLHDDLGQQLTAVAFLAQSLTRDLESKSPGPAEQASRIVNYLGAAISKIRLLAKGLYPVARDAAGEEIGFEQLAAESREIFSIDCKVIGKASFSGDTPGAAQQLYRVAQEAVRNAVKHGKASAVTIELSSIGGKPRMVIADNGIGFDESKTRPGLGLQIMRSRCRLLGLDPTISRAPNGGAVLCIA